MKTRAIWLGLSFLFGAVLVVMVQGGFHRADATASAEQYVSVRAPKRILVPFMHMRDFGSGAGHDSRSGEGLLGAGTEIEIWNTDESRSLTITEIYFNAWDGKSQLEGSKYGIPLPLELKPKTHYHFSSFYEHVTLPVPRLTKENKNFIHGYLADIRWTGPAPRVRGWDKGVKNGEYIHVMPVTVFEE
ncbi:MAG: hypothetical protein KF868_15055 [Acidobacteria bacterium]|nr:hypothetical protein [Acidobacteriota bacterium]MCW5970077.1 hypothetical protein [Blastocatellales bacterium]